MIMTTKFKPARNYYTDYSDGYTVARYLCQNAPTNVTRPKAGLDGHGYERFGVGNGPGWAWLAHIRTNRCPKCGGEMIPINQWVPKDAPQEVSNAENV
jgi:hypothetical protein